MNSILKKIWYWLRKNKNYLILAILVIAFFVGTSFYNQQTQSKDFVKWSSPDETANYTFAKLFAQEGRLEIPERYNTFVRDIMHPRSFRVNDGVLRPMSFLGIVLLYGKIAHYLGAGVIPYLTPFFAAIGLIFYYLLVKELFYKRLALVATVLLATFPVYVYFSSKSMFHNVLFLVMLIIGLYFVVLGTKRNRLVQSTNKFDWWQLLSFLLGGLAIGWAVATRSSELLWLGPVLLLTYLVNIRQIRFWQLLIILLAIIGALLPIAYYNQILYGGFFQSGYAEVNTSITSISNDSQSLVSSLGHVQFKPLSETVKHLSQTVFYFGFRPLYSLRLFLSYTVALFSWLSVGFIFGLIFWLMDYRKIKRGQIVLVVSLMILSAILIVYYGSWDIHDNPDKSAMTIGNSYTRYWLPIYAVMLVWVALAIEAIARNLGTKKYAWIISAGLTIWLGTISVQSVWAGSSESLKALIAGSAITRHQFELVLSQTERNAVIITKYQDKLFFPERKVVYGLFDDDNMIREYAKLTKRMPTYFYSFTFGPKDLKYLNERRLPRLGLRLDPLSTYNDFTLYRLVTH